MDYFFYLLFRAFTALVLSLPLIVVYRLGQTLGFLGWLLAVPYRRLVKENLAIAYGSSKTPTEIARLARQHFQTLGANLLSSIKTVRSDPAGIREVCPVEGIEHAIAALDQGKGIVMVLSHMGNWELYAPLCQVLPQYKWSCIYQPLGNKYIEAYVQKARSRATLMFNRKNGFNGPTAFLREGGAVGVLIDQHAGDRGTWTPLFGRLASTSTLSGILTRRTEAILVPMAVVTTGPARWKLVIFPPVPSVAADGTPLEVEAITARLNQTLERQVNTSPADWFWVHNRWKTPKPKFLLATYRRGIVLPADMTPDQLKPFRLLVRSPNWLGDAVMTIPAVQAIARGRPDARVTVLAPAKLADLWGGVPGVADVLPIEERGNLLEAVTTIRRAGSFDAAVLWPNSLRAALEAWLAGVPRRVGYAGHRRRWLLNQIIPEPPSSKVHGPVRPHQSERYAHFATEIGAEDVSPHGEPPPAEERAATPSRGGWLRLGICPGAEYGPTKRWFPERFAEAAKIVAGERACEIVLFGVEKDAALGAEIEKALEGVATCENLIGKTTLAELIPALRGCHLLLTNDTGTMHLAAYLGVSVAAVFGSTDPELTGPLAPPERVRILRHQVECSPCFLKKCPLDLRCMKIVGAEEAARAVLSLAGEERPEI